MSRKEYIKKLHESKVVINTLSPDNLIGPRFYETMASKAICLCEENNVINSIFKPMEHYVPLNSPDEILEKFGYTKKEIIEFKKKNVISDSWSDTYCPPGNPWENQIFNISKL